MRSTITTTKDDERQNRNRNLCVKATWPKKDATNVSAPGRCRVITARKEVSLSAIRLDSSRRTPSRFGFRLVGRKNDEKTTTPPKTKRKEEKRKKQRRISSGAPCARRMENSRAADVTVKESFCTDPRTGGKRCRAGFRERASATFIESWGKRCCFSCLY